MFLGRRDYKVTPTGRAGLIYSEAGKNLHVFSEALIGDEYEIIVYISRVKSWDSPNDDVVLTENDIDRIKRNISKALKVRIEWV